MTNKKRHSSNDRREDNDSRQLPKKVTIVATGTAKKAVIATAVGNSMEWFDFGIYSYLAVTIGRVFFPELSGPTQLVYSFATFAIAFLVRPIGGFVFGRLGDRLGRKRILVITLIMMALATLSMGLIPGYRTIGAAAPILLLLARLVQGFSTGGEYSGAMTFIAESTPDSKRGTFASGLEVGTLIGYIGGSGIVTLLSFLLGEAKMLDWGWRLPFLIAAPLGAIGFYLREHMEETPAFKAVKQTWEIQKRRPVSIRFLLAYYWRALLIGMLVVFFYNVVDYTVLTYMPAHLSSVLGYDDTSGLLLLLLVMIIMIPIVLAMGRLGDRIGVKRVIQGGLTGLILLTLPAFGLIGSGHPWAVFAGLLILAGLLASFQGTMPSLLPSLYYTSVRYSALSITYNVSVSLFGGTTPLIVAQLIRMTGNALVPAYYLIGACLIGIVIITFFVKETAGKPLRGSVPAVENNDEACDVRSADRPLWWQPERKALECRMNEREEEK
ncbi:MFS transporter [Sporolactobacillus sp. CQH2019]|uniref:MFS transporter n=1 Tax=Sporolactobacillus sp. CQH2019 TaxID=3023512 RepID=UPI002368A5B1|nr:MFS transporter [Sporolactobacillus sp. CQH2019]MDD9150887.1 MFS transporter [Sporolactobacillus sp. CQH2019]